MKRICLWMAILSMAMMLAGCSGGDSSLKKIKDRKVLKVGVKVDVPGIGFLNAQTNELEGLEIDLAKLIAEDMFGSGDALKPVSVTALTRETMLDNEEIDLVIATFTITDERKQKFHFTAPYFQDAIGLMTFKDAGYKGLEDMNGKTIGTVQFGTAYKALAAEAESLGVDVNIMQYASYPEVMVALLSGQVDAFSADKPMLWGYVDAQTEVLDASFGPQDYGIASKLDHTSLAKYLDDFLAKIEKDGRLAEIRARWAR